MWLMCLCQKISSIRVRSPIKFGYDLILFHSFSIVEFSFLPAGSQSKKVY
uniref:Uncharacterized protein n=1 Tax=Octopus bimaculoides TaxID=37653 RepID=A0A0L8GZZ4_OCTBM